MESAEDSLASQWHAAAAKASTKERAMQMFALVDPAQDKRIVQMIVAESAANECLFGYDIDLPIAQSTPRLILLSRSNNSRLKTWLLRAMRKVPIATLIGSTSDLTALASHFRQYIDVELEGLDSMYLALWDPAILGTLLGQRDDQTLNVPGPVLMQEQILELVSPLSHWWYTDRNGKLHDAIRSEWRGHSSRTRSGRFLLNSTQVDQLVEASVPDHLLQHIRQNQPELLERISYEQHYRFIQQQLKRARGHGLEGTGDLVNYLCIALAFGSTFDEWPLMAALLLEVKRRAITFGQALDKASEDELTARIQLPVLL